MRLKHIKLAGFKSFVDSTTIKFPDPMTAIVGPNGCGKSNVIDAVRWVLGESSAKNLRGDAMSDVIFNGASQRKPVSQASVELLFSDTQGRLSGSLAERNEVAIKRVVNRDGQNQYYLNGSKCRRRDVVDIFLGTGLGPRSYAIIEQGMISRLIESKPKDLRIFIDEAAGISKYKERRRETEIRLRHTEENLERLQDIQQTLKEQVEKLAEQAKQAQEYKSLRREERQLQQRVWIAKYQQYQKKLDDLSEQINAIAKQDLHIETELNALNSRWEIENEQLRDNESQQHKTQQQLLALTQQCAKLEQQLQHQQQQHKHTQHQRQKLVAEQQVLAEQLQDKQAALKTCENREADIQPEYDVLIATQEETTEQWQQQQDASKLAQLQYEQAKEQQYQLSLHQQRLQSEATNLQAQHQQLTEQLAAQADKPHQLDELQQQVREIEDAVTAQAAQQAELQQLLATSEQALAIAQEQEHTQQATLDQLDDALHARNLTIVALQSQQALVSQSHGESLANNLAMQHIQSQPVWAQLSINLEWQNALETVLSHFSAGVAVSEFPQALESKHIALVTTKTVLTVNPDSLLAQVTEGSAPSLLNDIGLADTLCDAQEILQSERWHSVVTKAGDWLGKNWWLRGNPATLAAEHNDVAQDGFFARKAQLEALQAEQTAQTASKAQAEEALQSFAAKREECQQQRQHQQQQQQVLQQQQQQNEQRFALTSQKLAHEQQKVQEQIEATTRLQEQLSSLDEQYSLTSARLDEASTLIDAHTEQLAESRHALEQQQQHTLALQQQRQLAEERAHAIKLQWQDAQWQKKAQQQAVEQLQQQQNALAERLQELLATEQDHESLALLDAQLQEAFALKLAAEQELQTLHSRAQRLDEQRQTTHQAVQAVEASMKHNADKQQRLRVDHERQRVLQETIHTQLQQLDKASVDLAQPVTIHIAQAEKQIQRLQQKVRDMGPVNLAAIAEYQTQAEKLQFMQQQHDDLSLAVDTLQKAIHKIDRETRQRFKETFDKINAGLQELFPKVFAGGSAWLALSEEEDVLDAGVHIMARPPGKKNATIHLLSGGEKALTALSLVFAIFRLNPAPFCLLDEVDAPLDDANVGRFCNLVQEMSNNVQFIYISHNKVAMEMASQLIGVTMYEPGVSRVVSVDVAEALQFADS